MGTVYVILYVKSDKLDKFGIIWDSAIRLTIGIGEVEFRDIEIGMRGFVELGFDEMGFGKKWESAN